MLALVTASGAAAAYEEVVVTDGGTLSGSLRFVGTLPRLDPIAVARHPEVCGERKAPEALVVGADGGVRGGWPA
ncbi:MAG: hypothetical protein HY216_01895 [Candidatus Rokubacteria bacterium]|nr:hypothetical protein [Candidatus Rokubacteria bacterium]